MNVHTYFMNNQDQELFDRTSLNVYIYLYDLITKQMHSSNES